MNHSAPAPAQSGPWVTNPQNYSEALARLPEVTVQLDGLLRMWEMQQTWSTAFPWQSRSTTPGTLNLKIWFPSESNQREWPSTRPPRTLNMRSMWVHFYGGPPTADSHKYQGTFQYGTPSMPQPYTIKAIAMAFEGVDWSMINIAHLPAVLNAFKPLDSLQCLIFDGCRLTPESLRNLEYALSVPSTVHQLYLDNCMYVIPHRHFLVQPQPSTQWARLTYLSLCNGAPIPGPQESQGLLLEALSFVNGARLETLRYSVSSSVDLWENLRSVLARFERLKDVQFMVRYAVYMSGPHVPNVLAQDKKSRKNVRSLKITYRISDQRPLVSLQQLSPGEQCWLQSIPAIVVRCTQPFFEVV